MPQNTNTSAAGCVMLAAGRLDEIGVVAGEMVVHDKWTNERIIKNAVTVQVKPADFHKAANAFAFGPAYSHPGCDLVYRSGEWGGVTVEIYTSGSALARLVYQPA